MPEPNKVVARASDDQVFSAFYDAMPWDYWVRELYVDPLEVIATNDATGGLERVPYTVAADGTVTFGDPVPVQVEYIDRPAATTASAKGPRLAPGAGAKTFATRDDFRKTIATTSPEGQNEENPMPDIDPKLLRSYLGLDPDATVEAVNEKLAEQAEAAAAKLATATDDQPTVESDALTPTIPEGFTLVPTVEHQRNSEFVDTALTNELEGALASAVKSKRILPANKDGLRTLAGTSDTERRRVIVMCTGDAEAVKAGTAIAPGTVGRLDAAGNAGTGADETAGAVQADRVAAKVARISGRKATTTSEGR